jgi:hypothetical protein
VFVPCSCFCSSSVYPRGPFCFLSLYFHSSRGLPPLVVTFLWLL